MPAVITLPKNLIEKGELVLLPRAEYEELLRVSKMQTELDRGLEESLREVWEGKVVGPFNNTKGLMKSLSS